MLSHIKNNRLFKKISSVTLDILIFIFGIILLISIYNIVQVKIMGNDYSSFFGYTIFEVQTGSMEPEISKGDWIIVKEGNDFLIEDIVTFKQDDNFITHRIIEKYNDTFITKGDANSAEDDPINKAQIVGEVVNIIPLFGFLRATLFNPYLLVALIITIYLFTSYKKKEGGSKVLDKLKQLVDNVLSKLKKDDEFKNNAMFNDDSKKSFENISNKPKFTDYEEKIEDYSGKEFASEEDIEDDKEEELSKTMFFRMVSVDEKEKNTIKENDLDIDDDEIDGDPEETEKLSSLFQEDDEEENLDKEEIKYPFAKIEEKEEIVEPKEIEDNQNDVRLSELGKISVYGVSMVSEEEVDDDKTEKVEEVVTKKIEKEEVKEENNEEKEEDDKLKLEMIFSKPEHKKSKDIISKAMAVKEEEINAMIDYILDISKIGTNELSIKKALVKSYLESRYYNIFSMNVANLESKKNLSKKNKYLLDDKTGVISENNGFERALKLRAKKILRRTGLALEEDASKLSKAYSGNDKSYDKKLEKYTMLVMLVAKLEYLIEAKLDMKSRKILYAKEIIKFISDYNIDNENIEATIKGVIDAQKSYRKTLKYFLERLNTEVFELQYYKLKNSKNKYLINLKHNIVFSGVYSDEVIDKAFAEGIVAEDKLNVELALLQSKMASNMIESDFENEYLIVLPNSLCQKESKFERLFRQNNEEYAKKNLLFLVSYDEFMKHAPIIKNLRKNGFRISALIGPDTKFSSKSKTNIALSEFIFIDKDTKGITDLEKVVLDNFKDKIIKDDIYSKLKETS